MTRFTKENILKDGKYLFFCPNGYDTLYKDRKFICRFRTAGVGTFATHLRKNWTVEAYFAEIDAGVAPLKIVKKTGYILPHIKKWLKAGGYPVSTAGYNQYMADEIAKWKKTESN